MPYCPRCGVELDSSTRVCPLCATPVPALEDLGPGEPAWPTSGVRAETQDPSKTYTTISERRNRVFWGIAGVFATAVLAVTATDLLTSKALTWSRYPLAALATGFFLLVSAIVWRRKIVLWAISWFVLVSLFLWILDIAGGNSGWSVALGFPLTVATYSVVALGVWATRAQRRGYNLFALLFFLADVELLAIDALVTAWTSGHFGWGWSLIATLALLPLAFFFGFLHFVLPRTPDFRRIFHFFPLP